MSFSYDANIGYESPGVTYDGDGQLNSRPAPSAEFVRRIQLPNIQKVLLLTVTASQWLKNISPANDGVPEPVYSSLQGAIKVLVVPGATYTGLSRDNGEQSLTKIEIPVEGYIQHPLEVLDEGEWGIFEGYVYVFPPTGTQWFGHTWQANLAFYFSTHPKKFRSAYWQPRLKSAPNLSLRIEPRWGSSESVSQVGGGNATLENADGYFDVFDSDLVQWDAGTAVLEIGIDLAGVGTAGEMDESLYQKIGTWRVESYERGDSVFTLGLKEIKTKLENNIPHLLFSRDDYPNLPNEAVGKPIPLAWGKIYGAKPVLIDATLKKFKVASHPITRFDGVRVRGSSGAWTDTNFASTDLVNAEFTLGSAWGSGEDVSVDFSGRKFTDGHLMTNCSDIMADLLDYVGETNLDSTSFIESKRLLKVGQNRYGAEVNSFAPSIYLDEQRTAKSVASEINTVAGSALFVDFTGNWRYVVFNADRGDELNNTSGVLPRTFTEQNIIGELRRTVDNRLVSSRVLVRYGRRRQENYTETLERELLRTQIIHKLPPQFPSADDGIELPLSERKDAVHWASRYLSTDAQPLVRVFLTVPWTGFLILPSDKVHVTYERNGFDAVLEVLEVGYDLIGGNVKLVCGNLRGFGDSFGYWVADISDDWPLGGAGWTGAVVTNKKQNYGFWSALDGTINNNETDMADFTDVRSHWAGRWF
jgi:hypothetical protein